MGKVARVEERIEAIKDRLEVSDEDVSPLMDVLRRLEKTRAEQAEELAVARREAASPLKTAWGEAQSLLDVLESAPDREDARVRLRAALRRVVDAVWCLFVNRPVASAVAGKAGRLRLAAVQVRFTGGEHRDFLIIHCSAHGNAAARQEARTWVRSFLEDGGGPLDLRRRGDAKKLLRELERLDLTPVVGEPKRKQSRSGN